MSRKLVFVGLFLAALPVLMVSAKVRGDDPPKKGSVVSGGKALVESERKKVSVVIGGKALVESERKKVSVVAGGKALVESVPMVEPAKPKPSSGPLVHGGEKAILKAMKEKASLDFVETPLKDAIDYLSQKHRIPIQLDSSALKEAGVDESTPITCKLSGIPLRSALEIILDELQLKWTIHHDVLMVTSPTKAESDEYMYTKLYDVTDLLATAMDYEAQNPLASIRETQDQVLVNGSNGPPPPALGDFGPPSSRKQSFSNNLRPIEDLLTTTVATKTWVDNGGTGSMSHYNRMLAITQTREVHMQIEQLLSELRARRHAVPTLSVELHWLWFDAKQRDRLLAGHAKSSHGQLSFSVDRQRLRQIAKEVPGFHGRVASLNGIGTVIDAGDRRLIITGAIPVVGGDGVGYEPVIGVPNVGVTAQVRSTFVPGTKTAMLDIASIITHWGPPRPPAIIGAEWPEDKQVVAWNDSPPPLAAKTTANSGPVAPPQPVAPSMKTRSARGGSASCPVDQPVMPTQQIATTLRVPLGEPVIVGSMTFAPAEGAGLGAAEKNPVEVYLIATTSIVQDATK